MHKIYTQTHKITFSKYTHRQEPSCSGNVKMPLATSSRRMNFAPRRTIRLLSGCERVLKRVADITRRDICTCRHRRHGVCVARDVPHSSQLPHCTHYIIFKMIGPRSWRSNGHCDTVGHRVRERLVIYRTNFVVHVPPAVRARDIRSHRRPDGIYYRSCLCSCFLTPTRKGNNIEKGIYLCISAWRYLACT